MKNEQPAEGVFRKYRNTIQIHHAWRTIQGEGPFVGTPAIFVRLSGCNLQCILCDTEYTKQRQEMKNEDAVDYVRSIYRSGLVVITGGEPFRQPIGPFIKGLLKAGYRVQVETNGTIYQHDMPYGAFTIVCSPKTSHVNPKLEPYINAMKYIIQAGEVDEIDGLPTMVLGMKVRAARPDRIRLLPSDIFVQPADEEDEKKNALNLEEALTSVMLFGYRICVQTHKILGLE